MGKQDRRESKADSLNFRQKYLDLFPKSPLLLLAMQNGGKRPPVFGTYCLFEL